MTHHITAAAYAAFCLAVSFARFAPDVAHLLSRLVSGRNQGVPHE